MKLFTRVVALTIIAALLLPVTTFAASPDNANYEQEKREEEINALLDARQEILLIDPVDIAQLNATDLKLHELGVDFLSEEDVAEQHPEAKASIDGSDNAVAAISDPTAVSVNSVVIPDSDINQWLSYRTSNYLYNGTYYNIQRLIAQPLVEEESPLWDEGSKTVNYSVNWEAGATTFLKKVVSAGASYVAPITSTVYDVLSSVWSSLRTTSYIDPTDVYYRWENSTSAVFSYVRLESQTDYDQDLVLIATKCQTSVAYVVDIDSWSQNGDGTSSPIPAQIAGTKMLYSTPTNYNSISRACYAYNNWSGGPVSDRITSISISGPESKAVVTIHPCLPEYPYALEY